MNAQLLAPKRFDELSEDELRAMAVATGCTRADWPRWDRLMLIAFFKNRHGDFVPEGMSNEAA